MDEESVLHINDGFTTINSLFRTKSKDGLVGSPSFTCGQFIEMKYRLNEEIISNEENPGQRFYGAFGSRSSNKSERH